MDLLETVIYNGLKAHPGSAYITSDGKALYALAEGGMFCWTGMDFSAMTEDEVNLYIQESLQRIV